MPDSRLARATMVSSTVYEYDEQSETLVFRSTYNLADEVVDVMQRSPIRRGEGVGGRMAMTLEPVQIADIAEAGAYTGPLYTADTRAAVTRPYRCAGCGAVHQVGPGARWSTVARLKAAGGPDCGGTVLRPMALGQAGARPAAGR